MKLADFVTLVLFTLPFGSGGLFAHAHHVDTDPKAETSGFAVDEKPGGEVDLTLAVFDQNGAAYRLGELIDKPTLFLFDYYACTSGCGLMTARLMQIIPAINLEIGKQYRIVSLSFDETEKPADAQHFRDNYAVNLPYKLTNDGWIFLTAAKPAIDSLAQEAGYHFKKIEGHRFMHANMLLVLSKSGRIIRYLPGPNFLPFDVSMALLEAERETPSLSIRRLVSYCFDFDPGSNRYVVRILHLVAAAGLLLVVVVIAIVLFYKKGRPSRADKGSRHDHGG